MNNSVNFPENNLIKEEAADWLIRLDADQSLSISEREQLSQWVNQSVRHRHELYRLARVWEKMNVLTDLAVPIGELNSRENKPHSGRNTWLPVAAMAVSLLVAVVVGLKWMQPESFEKFNDTYQTATGKQLSLPLADTSSIILNTNSKIRVAYSADFRDVYLERGEAYFTVAKDSSRPFRVFAGDGRIDAVGTAFSVYLKNEGVDVTVTEGVVNLVAIASQIEPDQSDMASRKDDQNGAQAHMVSLRVGQFGTIFSRSKKALTIEFADVMNLEARDLSRKVAWTKGSLIFSGESLSDVVAEVSRYTDISIEFSDQAIGEIRVGGVFPAGETEIMFDVLENTFDLNVIELDSKRVLISAKNNK